MSRRSLILTGCAIAAVAVVAVLGVVIGGGSDESGSDATPTPDAPLAEVPRELEECLAEQGVEAPSGGAPGQGTPPDQRQLEAIQACQEFLPEGAPAGGFGGPSPG